MNPEQRIGVLVPDEGDAMRGRAAAALLAVTAVTGCAQGSQVAASQVAASTTPVPVPASSSMPSAGPMPTASAAPSSAPTTRSTGSVAPSVAATSPAAQAIPWLDQSVAKIVIPQDLPLTRPVLYRSCHAADLAMAAQDNGAISGTRYGAIRFTNRSTRPCTLRGTPTAITGVTASGERRPVPITADGPGFKLDDVANLKPGDHGLLSLSSSGECGIAKPVFFAGFSLTLPSGNVLSAATPKPYQAFLLGCPYTVSSIGVPHHFLPEPTYPTDPIKATLHVPQSVTSGAAFDYTVTLTNPTTKAISLTPCPSYEETAFRKPDPHPDDATYQLNCAGHGTLDPGQSLTFAMRTAGIIPTGSGQVFWELQASNVFAAAWLTVA